MKEPHRIDSSRLTINAVNDHFVLSKVNLSNLPQDCTHILIDCTSGVSTIGSYQDLACIFDSFDDHIITEITIIHDDSLRTVNNHVFCNCKKLKKLNFENVSATNFSICPSFMPKMTLGCTNLTEVSVSGYNVEKVENTFFTIDNDEMVQDGTFFTDINPNTIVKLPSKVSNIARQTFKNVDELVQIEIPKNITNIEEQAFAECGLREVKIHDDVSDIGAGAFAGCSKLERVIIDSGNVEVDSTAFIGCNNIQEIIVPAESLNDIKLILPDPLRNKVCRRSKRLRKQNGLFPKIKPPQKKQKCENPNPGPPV